MDNGRLRRQALLNLLIIRVEIYMLILHRRAQRVVRAAVLPPVAPPRQRRRRVVYVHRERLSTLGLSDAEILTTYRFDMATIEFILGKIVDDITPVHCVHNYIPPLLKLLSVLHFCATGSFQNTTGVLHGIAQPTFSIILKQVLSAMMRLVDQYIYMPRTPQEFTAAKTGLYAIARFPNVVGCIDCTHIPLVPPRAHEQAYRNRKMSHSMNIQMVCDADLCFLQVCARFPGSAHDSRILRESSLFSFMEHRTPPRTLLLGDSGYPLLPWLMTPFRNPLTPGELAFNKAHISTRNCIERAFGVLKCRFRCLDRSGGALMYSPVKVGQIVVLCVMLHNIAIRRHVPLPDPLQPVGGDNDGDLRGVAVDGIEGRDIRDVIVVNYFT